MIQGVMGSQGGGIISSALQLIKEKERQGDKAMDRIHDGMKSQMELTGMQGSWTEDSSGAPRQVVKEKVVEKEKTTPDKSEDDEDLLKSPESDEEHEDRNVADMSILDLAKGASGN